MPAIGSAAMFHRSRKRPFKSPCAQAVSQSPVINAKSSSPIFLAQRNSVKSDKYIRPHVSVLFFRRSPTTIHRPALSNTLLAFAARIMSVTVHAVNGVFRSWPVAHVGKKGSERLAPALTNLCASTPIAFRAFVRQVVATLDHHLMTSVFRRCAKAVVARWNITPARLSVARNQRVHPRDMMALAIAQAFHALAPLFSVSFHVLRLDNQQTKALAYSRFGNHVNLLAGLRLNQQTN